MKKRQTYGVRLEVENGKAVKAELTRIAAESSGAAVLVKVAKRLFVVSQARLAQTFGAIAFKSH